MVQKKKLDENATMLYRMGFRDPDLKLQSHDDIVLWLYNNDNIILDLFEKNTYKFISLMKKESLNNLIINYNKRIEQNNITIGKIKLKIEKYDKWITKIKATNGDKEKLRFIIKECYHDYDTYHHHTIYEIKDYWNERIEKELFDKCNTISNNYKDKLNEEIKKGIQFNNIIQDFINKKEDPFFKCCIKHTENDFEYIIENSKKYDIGFIDLRRIILIESIEERNYDSFDFSELTLDNILNNKIVSIGFWDLISTDHIPLKEMSLDLYFEAKTEYFTLGELKRQLGLYRKYTLTDDQKTKELYFLVGPRHPTMEDFPEFLKQQGWIFVEIPFEIKNEIINNKNKKTILDFGG